MQYRWFCAVIRHDKKSGSVFAPPPEVGSTLEVKGRKYTVTDMVKNEDFAYLSVYDLTLE